ncbi:MAG: hypothetical protein IJ371_06735, partial [Clostridia bacterium]|nr:hypothetical protein [Clostridia bacterium]
EHYYEGQASNDGVFVFEWTGASDQDKFEVTEVKYNYYQLMDQITLNAITKDTLSNYPYYPYKYISTNYILQTEDGMETVSQYDKGTRNRSYPINLAYETYYDANGALTSKKVTQTGLYIITRTISMKVDENEQPQVSEYSYAFFVDRNMIVGYSITDINQKIVGQFIHVAMPNSEGSTAVKYDNFTKQGLKPQTNNGITYQVYLETNKLPTRVQVPSGKYVSGVYDNSSDKAISTIYATSYKNLKLKLSVYFLDSNGILPSPYKNAFVQLMDNKLVELDGFIELTFDNIDNQAVVTMFRNARIHGEDNSLSLPGTYVFVINDTVGSSLDKNYEVDKTNQFVFGVKLIDKKPTTDMYAYANIAGEESDKVYADESMELYTNQQYVDFIIPIEDLKSYEAQLDIANISIWRSTTEGGTKSLWLRLMRNTSGNITAATNGIIQDLSQVEEVYKDGKLVSYIIKLDTGLTIDGNGQIIDYKEYVYNIDIQYILENSGVKYYQYQKDGETKLFYSSSYKVVIDRTPNSDNLNNIMKGQNDYFEKYQAWLAEQNNTELTGAINQNYAYRSIESTADYYGLTNSLYYQFATTGGQLSSSAMYALNVDFTTTFNSSELSAIYYRRLDFNASNIANTRMGLLPITETYFVTNEYYTFNENLSA